MKKAAEKEILCKKCYTPLTGELQKLGVCERCIPSELSKIRKRIVISTVAGVCLALLLAWVYNYALKTHYVSDMKGYEGDIFVPVFSGHLTFTPKAFQRIMNYSVGTKTCFLLFFFCIPFTSFVRLGYKTHIHKIEQQTYDFGAFSGQMAAGANHRRMDDAGMFLMSVFISAVSGPFFLVYRLYKMAQLSRYMKNRQRRL